MEFNKEEIYAENYRLLKLAYKQENFIVVKKPRQCGGSSALLKLCVDNPDTKFVYVNNKYETAKYNKSRYKKILGDDDYCNVQFVSVASTAWIGGNLEDKVLIIDEAAFMQDKFWVSIATCPMKKIIMMSTPKYMSGFFYEAYSNVSNRAVVFKSTYDLSNNDVLETLSMLYEHRGIDDFKNEILAEFCEDKKTKKSSETINNIRIETLLYMMMVERIRRIEESTLHTYKLSPSDYIRELIKADIKHNILNLDSELDF